MKLTIFLLLFSVSCFGQVKNDVQKGRNYVDINQVTVSEIKCERLYCLGITKDTILKKIYLSWSLNDFTGRKSAKIGSVEMDVSGIPVDMDDMNVNQTVFMFKFIIKTDSINLKDVTIK